MVIKELRKEISMYCLLYILEIIGLKVEEIIVMVFNLLKLWEKLWEIFVISLEFIVLVIVGFFYFEY